MKNIFQKYSVNKRFLKDVNLYTDIIEVISFLNKNI